MSFLWGASSGTPVCNCINDIVMNQVGNSNFPPNGHLIFFLPTYTMKNKTREIQQKMAKARDRT
jgi:hypothetical protein